MAVSGGNRAIDGRCDYNAIVTDIVYLDNNATTRPLPDVVDAMVPFLREAYADPSSVHQFGQSVRHAVEGARVKKNSNLLTLAWMRRSIPAFEEEKSMGVTTEPLRTQSNPTPVFAASERRQ